MNEHWKIDLIVLGLAIVVFVAAILTGLKMRAIERDPNHMTQHEQNAALRRIDERVEILWKRQCDE